jgi:serine/threonine protein kinase
MVATGEVVGGRYLIEDLLARGGMADVFRARDVLSDRQVAVKALRGTADRHRFDVETRSLARFEHRNLVRLLDAGQLDDVPFLAMELVEGPSLADRLEHGPLSVAEAAQIGADIARGLAHVHARGVIHRDVKPSNILLARDGRALLGDFGVARLVDGGRVTDTRATIGTLAYLAPEQIGGGSLGPAADVYALGVVLIEALSGQLAFTGTRREMLAARTARDPHVPAHLPPPWPSLLQAMTSRDPMVRPDAGAVAARLTRTNAADPSIETAETATLPADPGVETAETDVLAETEAVSAIDVASARPRRASSASSGSSGPMSWALIALLGVLIVVGVMVAVVLAPDGGGEETPASGARDATEATQSTTTSTTAATSTTSTTSTATTVAATVPTAPRGEAPAATCADLDARQHELEAEKQQVDEIHRGDREARNQRRRELDDERRALDAQGRALGC